MWDVQWMTNGNRQQRQAGVGERRRGRGLNRWALTVVKYGRQQCGSVVVVGQTASTSITSELQQIIHSPVSGLM